MKNTLTCPFCENSHQWKKAKHFIAFFCPDMGIIHWTHYTREEVEEAKKEMEPVPNIRQLIKQFLS